MTYPRLATSVDIFHFVWVVVLLTCAFAPRSYRPWNLIPGTATLLCQAIFLGCPLTLLSNKLRGQTNGGSLTVSLLGNIGIRVSGWQVVLAIVLVTAATFFPFWRLARHA